MASTRALLLVAVYLVMAVDAAAALFCQRDVASWHGNIGRRFGLPWVSVKRNDGKFSDLIGRKNLVLGAIALFLGGSTLSGLAQNPEPDARPVLREKPLATTTSGTEL